MKALKERIRNREVTIGSWITFSNSAVAEIMARSGFDWLTVDLEHGAIGIEGVQHLIQVIDLCGCVPLVRLPGHDPIFVKRVMDAGARGVIIPLVSSPQEAIQIKNNVKYPPSGKRGMGLARAQGYDEFGRPSISRPFCSKARARFRNSFELIMPIPYDPFDH